MDNLHVILEYDVAEGFAGIRIDKFLADAGELSRARIQSLIAEGHVSVDGKILVSASMKLKGGERLSVSMPEIKPAHPKAENIKLDIVYEDDDLLVLNKEAGMVVHPGAGNHEGTLVNALLHHCKGSLSGIGGVERPGIVHRLDKDTSGLMAVAKTDKAHQGLSDQLADRSLSRIYEAIVLGIPIPSKGMIDKPIGRSVSNRLKKGVGGRDSRDAVTFYRLLQDIKGVFSHVECKLQTGRTHQIRVHMQAIGCPLLGDPLYGPQATLLNSKISKITEDTEIKAEIMGFWRQALHAKNIAFVHPVSGEKMEFGSDLPADMSKLLKLLNT